MTNKEEIDKFMDSIHKEQQLKEKIINLIQDFIRVNPDIKFLDTEKFSVLLKIARYSLFNEQNKDKIDEYTQNLHYSVRGFYWRHIEQYIDIDSLLKSLTDTVKYDNSSSVILDIEEKIKHNEIFLRELLVCLVSTPLHSLSSFFGVLMKEVLIKEVMIKEITKKQQEASHDPTA